MRITTARLRNVSLRRASSASLQACLSRGQVALKSAARALLPKLNLLLWPRALLKCCISGNSSVNLV